MLDKSQENRVRRHAERQGWRLERNPTRTHTAPQFGNYRLVRCDAGVMLEHGYPYTLQQAEDALRRSPAAVRRPYSAQKIADTRHRASEGEQISALADYFQVSRPTIYRELESV